MQHHSDTEHMIYLQMVWLKDLHVGGSLAKGAWNHRKDGTLVDYLRSMF